MSEPKWTPGPWFKSKYDRSIVSGDGMMTIYDEGGHTHEDAHLIAAAPDLYAALRDCVACGALSRDGVDSNATNALAQARAAIARARGES